MICLLNVIYAATNSLEFSVFGKRGLTILEPTSSNWQVRYYVLAIITINDVFSLLQSWIIFKVSTVLILKFHGL